MEQIGETSGQLGLAVRKWPGRREELVVIAEEHAGVNVLLRRWLIRRRPFCAHAQNGAAIGRDGMTTVLLATDLLATDLLVRSAADLTYGGRVKWEFWEDFYNRFLGRGLGGKRWVRGRL